MPALMVQGVSSWAGKSLLTTALARAFRRRGIDVVPFKAQNMSNNARVVHGGEIGSAQYLQALAAGVEPDVRMNPILVKPEGDNRSQVVVLGKPDLELSRRGWLERPTSLWPVIKAAMDGLASEHDLLLLEGAGSPAEINLQATDLANMRTAHAADAQVMLVADINRGGAFAHLYGTWALVNDDDRARLTGFVLNKFRGDPSLLADGPKQLEELTGVPTLGVLPWLDHGLPDEDGAAPQHVEGGRFAIGIVRYPTASNQDEFKQLEQVADVSWITDAREIGEADVLILPGSKHLAADLGWLVHTGIGTAIRQRARRGGRILAICGGMQMLGERIDDPAGVDGAAEGLGLLPIRTTFAALKRTERTTTRFRSLPEPWAMLGGLAICGYEIRHGATTTTGAVAEALSGSLGFVAGPILGVYLHGLFEQPEVVAAIVGTIPPRSLDQTFDELADAIEKHLDLAGLLESIGM